MFVVQSSVSSVQGLQAAKLFRELSDLGRRAEKIDYLFKKRQTGEVVFVQAQDDSFEAVISALMRLPRIFLNNDLLFQEQSDEIPPLPQERDACLAMIRVCINDLNALCGTLPDGAPLLKVIKVFLERIDISFICHAENPPFLETARLAESSLYEMAYDVYHSRALDFSPTSKNQGIASSLFKIYLEESADYLALKLESVMGKTVPQRTLFFQEVPALSLRACLIFLGEKLSQAQISLEDGVLELAVYLILKIVSTSHAVRSQQEAFNLSDDSLQYEDALARIGGVLTMNNVFRLLVAAVYLAVVMQEEDDFFLSDFARLLNLADKEMSQLQCALFEMMWQFDIGTFIGEQRICRQWHEAICRRYVEKAAVSCEREGWDMTDEWTVRIYLTESLIRIGVLGTSRMSPFLIKRLEGLQEFAFLHNLLPQEEYAPAAADEASKASEAACSVVGEQTNDSGVKSDSALNSDASMGVVVSEEDLTATAEETRLEKKGAVSLKAPPSCMFFSYSSSEGSRSSSLATTSGESSRSSSPATTSSEDSKSASPATASDMPTPDSSALLHGTWWSPNKRRSAVFDFSSEVAASIDCYDSPKT